MKSETAQAGRPRGGGRASSASADASAAASERRGAVAGVGAQLRSRRTAAGLSLRQFAKMLGVSASFISQIENGKSQPSVATLYQMCNALDITVDELFAASAGPSAAADDAADDAGDGAADGADRAAGQDEGDEAAGGAAGAAGRTTGGGSAAGGVTGGSGVTVTRAAGPQRGARRGSDLNAALATLNDAGPAHDGPVVTPGQRRRLVLDTGVTWEQLSSMHERAVDFMYVTYDVGGSSTSGELLTRHSGVEYGYVISGELEISLGFESYKLGPGDAISFDSSIPHRLDNVGSVPVKAIWVVHGRVRGHEH